MTVRKETPSEAALRKQFPTLYITLVSILIALAVEGLLGRLSSLSGDGSRAAVSLLVLQVSHFILIAATFWWISARWVTTVPWRFGFFDGLTTILLLVAFHFVSQSIGLSIQQWMVSFGVLAVGSSFAYRFNGRRGIEYTERSRELAKLHLVPTSIAAATGLGLLLGALLMRGSELGTTAGIVILVVTVAVTSAFAYADYWIWHKVANEPGRFDEQA